MSSSTGLVVPIILWGKDAPTHAINTCAISPDLTCIVTGCQDGHICIWDVTRGQGSNGNEYEVRMVTWWWHLKNCELEIYVYDLGVLMWD